MSTKICFSFYRYSVYSAQKSQKAIVCDQEITHVLLKELGYCMYNLFLGKKFDVEL